MEPIGSKLSYVESNKQIFFRPVETLVEKLREVSSARVTKAMLVFRFVTGGDVNVKEI